jgi:hypothetical protein
MRTTAAILAFAVLMAGSGFAQGQPAPGQAAAKTGVKTQAVSKFFAPGEIDPVLLLPAPPAPDAPASAEGRRTTPHCRGAYTGAPGAGQT